MGIAALLAQNSQALINLITANVSTITLSGANVILTEADYSSPILEFTGTLTENVLVTVPAKGIWTVYNATTGAFAVTLTSGSGAMVIVPQTTLSEVAVLGGMGVLLSSGGSSGGVTTFNTRSGSVTLEGTDITSAGGAMLVSPDFSGTPTSTTPPPGDNSQNIATTAFTMTALGQYAPLASPALTGNPTSTTQGNTSNNTSIATTAFVQNLVSAVAGGLNYQGAWNASTNTPTLTSGVGTKGYLYQVDVAGTTTLDGNSTWNVGDLLSFSGTVWQRIPAQTSGVTSFNTRTGSITLESSDVTTALGFTPANSTTVSGLAPLASPAFTGVPTAPTPVAGTNNTDIATTAFVAGNFAPLISPDFTGTPIAPTASPGTNNTQLATTAFVNTAVSAAGGGYAPLASPAFTGVPTAPTPVAGTSNTDIATTAFVATSFAPIASPTLTGRVQSPAYSYTVSQLGTLGAGTTTINLSAASEFTATISGAVTFAFTNTLASDIGQVVVLRLTNAGASGSSVLWPSSTKFVAKTPPTFTASGTDVIGVMYDVVTATYMVFVIGLNIG